MDGMYCKRRNKSILNFLDDILVIIFTKLSITTILECRRVCKALHIFLSSRYFAESYQSNPPFTSLIIYNKGRFSLLELKYGYNYSLESSKPKILPDPVGSSYTGPRSRFLVGSCNGFFCYSEKDVLYVCNPLSGTHVRLPKMQLDTVAMKTYGFGFCPQTQQYKVVELVSFVSRTEVQVFTVGIDEFWRRVHSPFQDIQRRMDMEYRIIPFWEVNGKGALHWILNDSNRLDYLYSFDIGEEEVRPIPPPVGLKKRNLSTRLVFMHGCLCLLHMKEDEEERVEFWCMTDYMVQDSWTLRIISQTCFPVSLEHNWFYPIGVWKNEEILVIYQGRYIVSCNLEQKMFRMLDIAHLESSDHAAVCFVPNFFSYLEAGTTEAETKDDARNLGLLPKKFSKPIEFGNRRATILKLPIFLLENIFSRVPVDTILCCKHVCKIWWQFLSNPCFAKTYYKLNNTVHVILCDKASSLRLFELKSDSDHSVKASQLLASEPPNDSNRAKVMVLGSFNGLICLSVLGHHPDNFHRICICNPVVRELAILPKPVEVKRIRDEAYGFGFGSMTGHYKVLRILTRKWRPGKIEAHVLTIGIDNNWREVGGDFGMLKKWPDNINKARFCDVPFNNAIHWIGEGDSNLVIYAFDIDDEEFKSLPPPPGMDGYSCLAILRDCLCVLHSQPLNVVELWSMKTYGRVKSWTREKISISLGGIVSIPPVNQRVILPVTSWRDEEILMWVEDGGGTLISYCSKEKTCSEIKTDIAANNEALIAVPYVQSFLSLKDAVREGHLEVNKMVI